jgi:hypothetical protein
MLTFAHLCSPMLTYADVCWRMKGVPKVLHKFVLECIRQHTSYVSIRHTSAYVIRQHTSYVSIRHTSAYVIRQRTSYVSIRHTSAYIIRQHTSYVSIRHTSAYVILQHTSYVSIRWRMLSNTGSSTPSTRVCAISTTPLPTLASRSG